MYNLYNKLYKSAGSFLIFLSIILILYFSFLELRNFKGLISIANILATSIIIIVLGFLPGRFYYRLDHRNSNTIIVSSLVLKISALVFVLPSIIYFSIRCLLLECVFNSSLFFFLISLGLMLYMMGILILLIHTLVERVS